MMMMKEEDELNTLGKQPIDQASHLKLHLKLKTPQERALSRVDRI